jgi:hypothetical protein
MTAAEIAANMMFGPPASGSVEVMRTGLDDAREPGQRAGQHEVAGLDPADLDAGLARARQVAAHGERVQPPARPGEQDLQQDHQPDRPDDLRVRAAAEDLRVGPLAGRVRRLPVRERQHEAVEEEEHAQRRDERRDADHGRDDAVDQPDPRAPDEASRTQSSSGMPASWNQTTMKAAMAKT